MSAIPPIDLNSFFKNLNSGPPQMHQWGDPPPQWRFTPSIPLANYTLPQMPKPGDPPPKFRFNPNGPAFPSFPIRPSTPPSQGSNESGQGLGLREIISVGAGLVEGARLVGNLYNMVAGEDEQQKKHQTESDSYVLQIFGQGQCGNITDPKKLQAIVSGTFKRYPGPAVFLQGQYEKCLKEAEANQQNKKGS